MAPPLKARPFLKWAGGKTRLLETLAEILPQDIGTYYEPFIGGGALFFHLAHHRRFEQAVINDFNPELVNCYQTIRDDVEGLIEHLKTLQVSREAFQDLRDSQPLMLPPVERAARTIYLNKTGFNGLYRLNKRGAFNVPWGNYKAPRILDEDNLRACSAILKGPVRLSDGDFVRAVQDAGPGDAVYFDPPYVPLTVTSSFKSYTAEGFTLEDQQRLGTCFRDLAARRVIALVSNSDTAVVREIYQGFDIRVVQMRRNINSKGDKRGPINELLVTSRPAQ